MKKDKSAGKKNKKGLHASFASKTFSIVFSLFAAVVLWFVTNYNSTQSTRTITKVPITVSLSEEAEADDIKIFKYEKEAGSIKVSGTGQVINSLTSDSVTLTGTLDVNAGMLSDSKISMATIPITASKSDKSNELRTDKVSESINYTIVNSNPEEINVYYDKAAEQSFQLDVSSLGISAADGYYIYNSETAAEAVNISGPASAVSRISRVVLTTDDNTTNLSETTTLHCNVVCLDESSSVINPSDYYIELDKTTFDYTVTVISTKEVEIQVSTSNMPDEFGKQNITVSPATVEIAGDAATLESITSLITDTLDFADIDEENTTFTRKISSVPQGVKIISMGSESDEVTITVNLNGFKSRAFKSVPASSIEIINIPEGKSASIVTESISVNIMGSESQVKNLSVDDISGVVDLSYYASDSEETSIATGVPVSVKLNGTTNCWVTGKIYVDVQLSTADDESKENSDSSNEVAAANEDSASQVSSDPESEENISSNSK